MLIVLDSLKYNPKYILQLPYLALSLKLLFLGEWQVKDEKNHHTKQLNQFLYQLLLKKVNKIYRDILG